MAMNIISVQIPNNLAATLQEKLALLHSLKLYNLELTDDEVPIERLSISQVCDIRELLIDEGCSINLYGTSLSPNDRTSLNTLLQNAHLLGIPYIRLDLSLCSKEDATYFIDAMDSYGITPLIENSANSTFRESNQLMNFLKQYPDSVCGIIFNPLEYVKTGCHPFFNIYYAGRLKNHISVLRINDGLYKDGSAVLPGHGNGEVKELISIMKSRSFKGTFSITPYLPSSTMESLSEIVQWLRQVLKNI